MMPYRPDGVLYRVQSSPSSRTVLLGLASKSCSNAIGYQYRRSSAPIGHAWRCAEAGDRAVGALLGRAQPAGHAVRGDPPQHDRERLGHYLGRHAESRRCVPFPQRIEYPLAALDLRLPVPAAPWLGADGPRRVHVPQGLGHLVPLEQEDVVRLGEEARLDEGVAERAHLAPQHRVRPVLDVEVVILYIWENGAGQAELGV